MDLRRRHVELRSTLTTGRPALSREWATLDVTAVEDRPTRPQEQGTSTY